MEDTNAVVNLTVNRIFEKFAEFPRNGISSFIRTRYFFTVSFSTTDSDVRFGNEDVLCKFADIVAGTRERIRIFVLAEISKKRDQALFNFPSLAKLKAHCSKIFFLEITKGRNQNNFSIFISQRERMKKNTFSRSSGNRMDAIQRLVNNWSKKSTMVAINESRFLDEVCFHL